MNKKYIKPGLIKNYVFLLDVIVLIIISIIIKISVRGLYEQLGLHDNSLLSFTIISLIYFLLRYLIVNLLIRFKLINLKYFYLKSIYIPLFIGILMFLLEPYISILCIMAWCTISFPVIKDDVKGPYIKEIEFEKRFFVSKSIIEATEAANGIALFNWHNAIINKITSVYDQMLDPRFKLNSDGIKQVQAELQARTAELNTVLEEAKPYIDESKVSLLSKMKFRAPYIDTLDHHVFQESWWKQVIKEDKRLLTEQKYILSEYNSIFKETFKNNLFKVSNQVMKDLPANADLVKVTNIVENNIELYKDKDSKFICDKIAKELGLEKLNHVKF